MRITNELAWGLSEILSQKNYVDFLSHFGCSPTFLPKIEFWLRGGGEFSPPITIFYWPEVTLKVLTKSELVEFFHNLGCPPQGLAFWYLGPQQWYSYDTSIKNFSQSATSKLLENMVEIRYRYVTSIILSQYSYTYTRLIQGYLWNSFYATAKI